jgi:hypothetical protein
MMLMATTNKIAPQKKCRKEDYIWKGFPKKVSTKKSGKK